MRVKNDVDARIVFLTADYCSLADKIAKDRPVELDMGCGNGSFTTQLAQRYPERQIFGSDVMLGRLRKLQRRNERLGVENLMALRVESRHLIGYMLPDACIDRLHLLCPDPWPKDKHRANRLMASDFLGRIARVLKPGGVFHFSSDDPEYFDPVVALINACGRFEFAPETLADIADIRSDFENRWIELGKTVRHAAWRRSV